uniref:Uncharacterized protein n=1 Tax=Burkholderia sp. (strain CCGE1003) TaxID=640512 RepID=E1TJG3_BURSG
MTPPGPSPHVWPRAQLAPSDEMLRKRALFMILRRLDARA